jgi:AcrR family transcriptional regulator
VSDVVYDGYPRPKRGKPRETRARLVAAAAEMFNDVGYDGTDSNRIARAAGYAPGTFYKHFTDKKEIFQAVYAEWVTTEWRAVAATLDEPSPPAARAAAIVDMFIAHHQRWRGFRAGLRALVAVDEEIRDFYRAQRRRQLDLLAGLSRERRTREEHATLLFTFERVADAIADGEATALGLKPSRLRRLLVDSVAALLA